jgi:hypothetical protein
VIARQEAQPGSNLWQRADGKMEQNSDKIERVRKGLFVEMAIEDNNAETLNSGYKCQDSEKSERGSDISQIPFPAF